MHNTEHKADIVITRHTIGDTYDVWQKDEIIANGTPAAIDLIITGAAAHGLTVYDAVNGQWLVATIGQLDREA